MWVAGILVSVVSAIVGHAGFSRMKLPLNVVARFLIVGSIVGAGFACWLFENFGVTAPQLWAGLLTYGFICELYVFLFTLAMSSISANLLITLLRRKMTDLDIERLYNSGGMVIARLDRLISVGLLEETSNGLKPTQKGAQMVRIFGGLRIFFRHSE